MKKQVVSILIILFAVTLIFIPKASAHFLSTDNNIGAVLHIDPDDDPIAGQQAGFFFEIKDKTGKFQASNCYCRVDIYESGQVINSDAVFQDTTQNPTLNSTALFFTFPKRDVYTIELIGRPRTPNAFQPFTLTWNIRVDRLSATTASQTPSWFLSHLPAIILVGIIAIVLLVYVFIVKIKKGGGQNDQKTHKNDSSDKHFHTY